MMTDIRRHENIMESEDDTATSVPRKNSFIETINSVQGRPRKDSVAPLAFNAPFEEEKTNRKSLPALGQEGMLVNEKVKRFSRRLSLKPPSNVYSASRERSPKGSLYTTLPRGPHQHGKPLGSQFTGAQKQHLVKCDCGRQYEIPCTVVSASPYKVPTIALSGVQITELRKVTTEPSEENGPLPLTDGKEPLLDGKDLHIPEQPRRPSLQETIDSIKAQPDDYMNTLKCCMEIGKVDDQDSLEAVLSRQLAIQCLLDAMTKFPQSEELQLEACRSLVMQVRHSEASLHYLSENRGIERLHNNTKQFPEDKEMLAIILDIFGYYSFRDEWRISLTEKVNPSDFLTTMARHENDVIIIERCCVVVGNLVLSADIARSMMYVGGVHSIISMMTKFNQNVDILKHCCTALGNFASHDDTCQAVSEAGATCAVMTVMTSYASNQEIQESSCWALASLSRSDCVCMELMCLDAFSALLNAMTSFPYEMCIQEYGCWAICNLSVLAVRLSDSDCQTAIERLIDNSVALKHNVELLEHICYAINTLVSLKECVHGTLVRNDGIERLIELMKTYEDNVDIQVNSCKVIGNLAVNYDFRRYLEDMGASEAVIACMLKLDKVPNVQNTGCMALTNLSADVVDNKFRILKNGGVHAVLQAMSSCRDDETIQLNGLKLLCNLLESDKGCWRIAEESGIQIISMTLKSFSFIPDILTYGCTCLANLPRRGMNGVALESVESTLLYLRLSESTSLEVAKSVCTFYENAIKSGRECKKLFNKNAMEKVVHIMQDFNDLDVQTTGCRIIAQAAIEKEFNLLTRETAVVLLSAMNDNMDNYDIQMICCGTISYLSGSEAGLEKLQELYCIDAILRSMKAFMQSVDIQIICLQALENFSAADLVRGSTTQNVCDAVALCTKAHPNNKEIQLGGCHILSIIGKGFQKQNEQRRRSVDFLEIPSSLVHRKSVTEEILEVASAAIQKLKKFKDDVLEDNDGYYSSPDEFGMELKPANITASRNSIGFDSSDLEEHLSES